MNKTKIMLTFNLVRLAIFIAALKLLRKLDDKAIVMNTKNINEALETGTVPQEWRSAKVSLIPKPGKALSIDNLRPISLTSCVGKEAQHAILNHIIDHIENNGLFRHDIIGLSRALSKQDAMLMLREHICYGFFHSPKAISALNLAKAFDTVKHQNMLGKISRINLGEKLYNYI